MGLKATVPRIAENKVSFSRPAAFTYHFTTRCEDAFHARTNFPRACIRRQGNGCRKHCREPRQTTCTPMTTLGCINVKPRPLQMGPKQEHSPVWSNQYDACDRHRTQGSVLPSASQCANPGLSSSVYLCNALSIREGQCQSSFL